MTEQGANPLSRLDNPKTWERYERRWRYLAYIAGTCSVRAARSVALSELKDEFANAMRINAWLERTGGSSGV